MMSHVAHESGKEHRRPFVPYGSKNGPQTRVGQGATECHVLQS